MPIDADSLASSQSTIPTALDFRERHLARLLLSLYYCGTPTNSLFEGETRLIESPTQVQRFDFWMREPGHLALALLYCLRVDASGAASQREGVILAIKRMVDGAALDTHRVSTVGSYHNTYAEMDDYLSYLTSTALLTDRPSFGRNHQAAHHIVLETPGIALVERVLAECAAWGWYKQQAELIVRCSSLLEKIDLNIMPYLAPDVSTALAAVIPLTPVVSTRLSKFLGDAS